MRPSRACPARGPRLNAAWGGAMGKGRGCGPSVMAKANHVASACGTSSDANAEGLAQLFEGARSGDSALVATLLDAGYYVDCTDKARCTDPAAPCTPTPLAAPRLWRMPLHTCRRLRAALALAREFPELREGQDSGRSIKTPVIQS